MTEGHLKDARSWLKASNAHYIGSHDWVVDEDTNNDSIKIVEKLYEKGATNVKVNIYNEEDCACELFVTLPGEVEQIINVLCYLGELYADDVTEKDGVVNVVWGD
jgi:hypothetical protein